MTIAQAGVDRADHERGIERAIGLDLVALPDEAELLAPVALAKQRDRLLARQRLILILQTRAPPVTGELGTAGRLVSAATDSISDVVSLTFQRRSAILLIGGDKTGDGRFYERMTPVADELYDLHLTELKQEGLIP